MTKREAAERNKNNGFGILCSINDNSTWRQNCPFLKTECPGASFAFNQEDCKNFCTQWLKDNPEEKEMNTPISKDILNRIEHLEELAGIKKGTKQNQKDFFKDLAEAMEKHGVTDIYGYARYDINYLCFDFDDEEIETESGYLDDIKKLSE